MDAEKHLQDQNLKDIVLQYFPGIYSHWAETCVRTSKQVTVPFDGVLDNERKARLEEEYCKLGPAHDDGHVIPVLTDLCENFLLDQSVTSTFTFDELVDYVAEEDMLKLYLACSDHAGFSGRMTLRCSKRSVTIENTCDWVQDLMIRSFLREHLPDINSETEAKKALEVKCHSRTGRKPHDPRVPIIMKGLHTMLTETHDFSTPMPNRMCAFIIFYLDLCKIRPSEKEIDIPWVRAQLRYILSKDS